MKAIQMHKTGAVDVLKYEDVQTPAPGKGQVLVKVVSASVNFADVMVRKGTYPFMPPLPATPGLECSGIVEAVGEGVPRVRPGQPVVLLGEKCYAEYVLADAASVTPITEELDMDEAAAVIVNYATAYHMLHTMGQIQPGQTILIHAAAGGVGTAVIQLAKEAGAKVIGLTSSREKVEYTVKQGIDYIINYRTDNVVKRIMEITYKKGVPLVLNSVAGNTFERDLEVLAPFGNIIWFGFAAGPPEGNLAEQLGAHFGKSVGVRTFVIYTVAQSAPDLMAQSLDRLFTQLAEKKIRPHIHERMPLSEAARAHELLESGAVMGKLILKP
jgi:NADPH2:quinone reductase